MKATNKQLPTLLNKGLSSVYLIASDEPLLKIEAREMILDSAKKQGYLTREIFELETGIDWNDFSMQSQSLSLFSDQKILDVRLGSKKMPLPGQKIMQAYCADLPPDQILVVTSPKLDTSAQKTKWVKAMEAAGVLVTIWPLNPNEQRSWMAQKCQSLGLKMTPDALNQLLYYTEGNLLAANQAINKLPLLSKTEIAAKDVGDVISDSAQFNVFLLADCAMSGQGQRTLRMIDTLKDTGTESILALWSLNRALNTLYQLKFAQAQGQHLAGLMQKLRIFPNQQPLYRDALSRLDLKELQSLIELAKDIDFEIKGLKRQDPWLDIKTLGLRLAGHKVLA